MWNSCTTPTQSLNPSQITALTPRTHYPNFSQIAIPSQPHFLIVNALDGYQQTTQQGTTANDRDNFLWEVIHNVQQLNKMMAVI